MFSLAHLLDIKLMPRIKDINSNAYYHLVANLVILQNVDSMIKVINKHKRQRFNIKAEALRSLSPYRTEHINLLGSYSLKIAKQQSKRNFKLM